MRTVAELCRCIPPLIAEGFLDYIGNLPAGSSMWPDIEPDAVFGLRSTTAGRKMARWLRTKLDVADPLISPNHSWRHWFIGACRKIVMPIEVRSAITGHSAKMDESAAYADGMGTFVQVVAGYMAKVRAPLVDGGRARVASSRAAELPPREREHGHGDAAI